MRYNYQEFNDRIVVDGGIVDREMWKEYEHGKEFIAYDELQHALKRRDHVPLVVDTQHDHQTNIMDARKIVGAVRLKPCPKHRGVNGVYTFYKASTPLWVLDAIRQGRRLPLSPFKFINVRDRHQQDILYDHVAVLTDSSPRCAPEEGCGVGVYDSMSPEEKEKLEEKEKKPEAVKAPADAPAEVKEALSEPLPSKEPEEVKPAAPADDVTEVTTGSEQLDAVSEVEQLKEEVKAKEKEIEAKEAELNKEREPLIGLLLQRGISRESAEAMNLADLRTLAHALQGQQTQGLPGTVPAPAVEPKTYAEEKATKEKKFQKDLVEQSKKEFEDW